MITFIIIGLVLCTFVMIDLGRAELYQDKPTQEEIDELQKVEYTKEQLKELGQKTEATCRFPGC